MIKKGNNLISKAYIAIVIALLVGVLAMQNEQFLGRELWPEETEVKQVATFTNDDVKKIFPQATTAQMRNDTIIVFHKMTEIGWAYNTSPASDDIVGFASSVPLLIGIDKENKFAGLTLLKNYESPDFVQKIEKTSFLSSWNGVPINDLAEQKVDAVSGATMTSSAVIKTIKHSAGILTNQSVSLSVDKDFASQAKMVLGYILLALALVQFFFPNKIKSIRTYYQIAIVVILGFWSGTFLSMFSFNSWLIYGVDLPAKMFIFIILVLSVILPLFTNKSFYCTHLCPFGASQDLLGKVRKGNIKLSPKAKEFLSTLREKIFACLMLLLFTGVSFDLTNIEPFSAFLFRSAAIPVIVLAVAFLILAIFIPRPWCRYACPTGHLLEVIRKPIKK